MNGRPADGNVAEPSGPTGSADAGVGKVSTVAVLASGQRLALVATSSRPSWMAPDANVGFFAVSQLSSTLL